MSNESLINRLKGAVARALMIIGGLVVGLTFMTLFLSLLLLRRERIPRSMILELDLDRGLIEAVPEDPVGAFLRRGDLTLRDAVEALTRAETDNRVRAVVARIGAGELGIAQVEELRSAVARFRATGKPAILFSETFGEFSPGRGGYYLATAFDEIHLQPSGDVGLAGLIVELPYLASALGSLGIEPQMDGRHEYKNALDMFTEDSMTEPEREAISRILASIYENLVSGIAEGRGLDPVRVQELIDHGPYLGPEALQAGLVDRLSYRDEVYDSIRARVGGEFLFAQRYLKRAGRPNQRGPSIALIYGTGVIQRGESKVDPRIAGSAMGSETVGRAFREAIEDDDIRAILFRVDSPGGSYVASDIIWRETMRARAAGKPVIVSMGNTAASGGYFVAMAAERIIAQPSTITGSIGVFGGKMLFAGLSEKAGVTWDDVRVGGNATMWSSLERYSPEEWERLQAALDRIYEDFTAKVAQGRGLSRDSTHAVARGRVWTGADAVRLGLVDELGGLDTAIRAAKKAAGISIEDEVRIRQFPRQRTFLEMLLEPGPSSGYPTAVQDVLRAAALVEPMVEHARRLGLLGRGGVLMAPWVPVVR